MIKEEGLIARVTQLCDAAETTACRMILAGLYESSGKKDLALNQIKEAIRISKGNEILYHALAQFYARNDMVKEALDEYEGILNKNPDDLQAAMMLALINQNRGKVTDAKKVYTYILEKDPKNALAANNMAWILAQDGTGNDLNEALRLAQIAKDKFPEDPRIADTLGYVYFKKGLVENALAQFQLATERLPDDPSVNYHTALALAELKRGNEAVDYLQKAMNTKTDFEEKTSAQELLARLKAENKE